METVLNLTWLIPLFPLAAVVLVTLGSLPKAPAFLAVFYKRKKVAARTVIGAMAISLVLATLVFVAVLRNEHTMDRLKGHAAEPAVTAPAEGGEAAPAEGGEVAPAEGGAVAPAEGGEVEHGGGEEALSLPTPIWQVPIPWMDTGNTRLMLGLWVDPLNAGMLFMVTLVGLCIFIYAQGYMAAEDYDGEDQRYSRFFSYLGLFAASMLGLLVADNILLLFICWELVGLCSYLLIGFWNFKASASNAAVKAFITTKVGDAGFFLGILLLYFYTGQLGIGPIIHNLPITVQGNEVLALDYLKATPLFGGVSVAALAALGLFIGTMGKSAQFPLHVWLPDAMEGPTPVSALIHAATMVAAGVFMVARMFPLFQAAGPGVLSFVAWVGGITAIFAATIAIAQYDIKRVLAYSTISQLGFMVLGLGLSGYVAGYFHLLTHAFFKALLFLGSGAVIIAAHHVQDMRELGGLRKRIPYTFITYLIGMLALSGAPFLFSGFWSKDEILLDAYKNNTALWIIGTVAAFTTAFYMTRQMFMVFAGKPRSHGADAASEVPLFGKAPVLVPAEHAAHGGPALATAESAAGHGGHGHGEPHVRVETMHDQPAHVSHPPHDEHSHEQHGGHAAPLPLNMTVPLMVLAFFTMFLSVVGIPLKTGGTLFSRYVGAHAAFDWTVALISIGAAGLGMFLGWVVYGRHLLQTAQDPDPLEEMMKRVKLGWLFKVWNHKYYVDEIYMFVFVQGTHKLAAAFFWFDKTIIDGAVNGTVTLARALSQGFAWFDMNVVDGAVNWFAKVGHVLSLAYGWFDRVVVDGIVNGVGFGTAWIGNRVRKAQTGRLQDYLLYVVAGALVFGALFVYWGVIRKVLGL